MLVAKWRSARKPRHDEMTDDTFLLVCIWIGFRFIPFPLGDHLGPFWEEGRRNDTIELLFDRSMFGLHGKRSEQVPEKKIT